MCKHKIENVSLFVEKHKEWGGMEGEAVESDKRPRRFVLQIFNGSSTFFIYGLDILEKLDII